MMLGSANKVIRIYGIAIGSLDRKFQLETEVTKVDRGTLLTLDNRGYAEMMEKYPYLDGVSMDNSDQKPELPIHIILGASEYAKIDRKHTEDWTSWRACSRANKVRMDYNVTWKGRCS